jgi:general secretion pathway protein G
MLRREDGFTMIELLVVMIIMAILVAAGLAFHFGARERASDATAKSNIRTAVPAIEAFRGDNQGYDGMTVAGLKAVYSPGIGNIVVEWTAPDDYCVSSTVSGRSWWKRGPAGAITTTSC